MEIERKFLVNEDKLLSSIHLDNYEKQEIEQAYICVEENEVRIRKIENGYGDYKCFMTIKSKGDLLRQEVELEIPYSKYRAIIINKMYKGIIINKFRYKIPLEQGFIAELDIYDKELFGLIVVEVEFTTIEQAKQFEKPDWFGKDVTTDNEYKNKILAIKKDN